MTSASGKSLTFRLTLLFASASTAVLLALGFVITDLLERHFEHQDLEVMTGILERVRIIVEKAGSRAQSDRLARQLEDALAGHQGLSVALRTPNGDDVLAGHRREFAPALPQAVWQASAEQPLMWKKDAREFRAISAPLAAKLAGRGPIFAAVAMDVSDHGQFMAKFGYALWIFVACAAALTGLLGWVAARRGLAPLTAMKQGAAAVTASGLSYRLPVGSIPSELAELAQTLNDMLARLQDSFQRLSDFSSDLAHELRTPVSALLTQTQVALSRAREPEEYRQVLVSNAEELERLARMVSDMLFLARSDHGLAELDWEEVNLGDEVHSLFEFYDALAEEKGVRLVLEGSANACCDRDMLRRAMSNLLSNAIRHTHPGGAIAIRIREHDEHGVSLTVENDGEGIPREHLPRLFDRFYRVDPSRHRRGEGAGLGLAITRAIIRAHGGEIAARCEGTRAVFEVGIPHFGKHRRAQSWLPTPITDW